MHSLLTSNHKNPRRKMRKIEQEMLDASDDNVAYWKKDNTRVETPEDGWSTYVYLHDNQIADICMKTDTMLISDCGWQTSTTKSRLNALLQWYTPNGTHIYQRKHRWYLDYGDGDVIEMKEGAHYLIHLVDINSIHGDNTYDLV